MTLLSMLVVALAFGGTPLVAMDPAPPAQVPAASPAPAQAPAPAASPKQLREIGRVRATVCGNIVVHANSAISSALRNDTTIGHTVTRLRAVDLENADPLAYHNDITELDNLAAQLHDNAVHGVGEIQRLRELAKESKDPARKAELEKFADSLGGALYKQKQVSIDLTGYVAYLYARDMKHTPEIDMAIATDHMDPPQKVMGGSAQAPMPIPSPFTLWNAVHASLKENSQRAASDFEQRAQEISVDESNAANHAEGAVSGC
jgi:hypothetical protein